ncbi:signal peptidase I [Fusibacter ferrireducens]|uniref:Signal peptidase I n=1 Tax=Fusibacter ferrireducens TaxID=2785058 RepID=A0ABR9ZSB3_9FIRM|nr:signal peptidase I [Fusibacter ferrireducens]MBF4693231.1 signal peptidase I [Fusibacter ferrireducens]
MDKIKKELLEWGQAILVTLVIFLIYNFFFATTTVYNTSMFPTLVEKDMLFMVKRSELKAGDIVSFKSDLTLSARDIDSLNFIQKLLHHEGERKNLIKRVIAVPGDSIEVKDGEVIVNGIILDEPYINTVTNKSAYYEKIPEGMYFCMGDNRFVSYDSREIGLISGDDMIGKVVFRFMPLSKIGKVN